MDIVIPISFLAGTFILGYLIGNFTEKYRLKVMLSLSNKVFEEIPCWKKMEKTLEIWKSLRHLFYAWKGSLTSSQYFAAVLLIDELDQILCLDDDRETDPVDENE